MIFALKIDWGLVLKTLNYRLNMQMSYIVDVKYNQTLIP